MFLLRPKRKKRKKERKERKKERDKEKEENYWSIKGNKKKKN